MSEYCDEKIHLKIPKQVLWDHLPQNFIVHVTSYIKVIERGEGGDSRGPEKIVIPAVFQVFTF